jgi:hypothetical protein
MSFLDEIKERSDTEALGDILTSFTYVRRWTVPGGHDLASGVEEVRLDVARPLSCDVDDAVTRRRAVESIDRGDPPPNANAAFSMDLFALE